MSHVSPHGRDLAIWIAVFTTVIFAVLGLRFYVIFKVKRRDFRLDDAVILLSVAALLAMEGTTLWGSSMFFLSCTLFLLFFPCLILSRKEKPFV